MTPNEFEGSVGSLPRPGSSTAPNGVQVTRNQLAIGQQCKITIFTPTYNRGGLLGKAYESLKAQTCKDFEWIIVDDGSSDQTEVLCKQWVTEESGFAISYCRTENGGKHRAVNRGVALAKGDLFFILDSDDCLTADAISVIKEHEQELPTREKFAGLGFLRGVSEDKEMGTSFRGDYLDCKQSERWKHRIFGDKAEVFFTHVLRCHPFPEFEGEKFLTEDAVWFQIAAAGYKIRWINKIIYLGDYLADGLTASLERRELASPKGLCYAASVYASSKEFALRYKVGIVYHCFFIAKKTGMPDVEIFRRLGLAPLTVRSMLLIENALRVFRAVRRGCRQTFGRRVP